VSDVVLSVPVDAGDVNPLLESLQKINETLTQINSTSSSAFSQLSKGLDKPTKDLDKTNKKLKETHKTIGGILDKIKVSGLMKMGAKVLGAGAGLLGISAGAMMFGAVMNADKNVQQGYEGKGVGLSVGEMKALSVTSEKMYGDQGKLSTALSALTKVMQSAGGSETLATLGLNQQQLQAMNPAEALASVMDAIKNAPTDISSEYLQKAFSQATGGVIDFNATVKEGSGDLMSFFNTFQQKYSGVDFDALQKSSQALIDFKAQLDIASQKIGSKLAIPISELLDKLSPSIDKFAGYIGKIIDSISQEDVDNFVNGIEKLFSIIGKVAGIAWNAGTGVAGFVESAVKDDGQKELNERNEKLKTGDVAGAIGSDLVGGSKQLVGGVIKEAGNLLDLFGGTPEESKKAKENLSAPFKSAGENISNAGKKLTVPLDPITLKPVNNTKTTPDKPKTDLAKPMVPDKPKTDLAKPMVPDKPKTDLAKPMVPDKPKNSTDNQNIPYGIKPKNTSELTTGVNNPKSYYGSNAPVGESKKIDYHPTFIVKDSKEAASTNNASLDKIIQLQGIGK
jgi:hypothetical protein